MDEQKDLPKKITLPAIAERGFGQLAKNLLAMSSYNLILARYSSISTYSAGGWAFPSAVPDFYVRELFGSCHLYCTDNIRSSTIDTSRAPVIQAPSIRPTPIARPPSAAQSA
ncbi:hypothetical protein SAMN04488127_2843 [Bhargavaea ginsengi]|uniref:Uncharacterized protein n=1 Tax=Bhargavaea ginsengi TaxID=426757 RepID=A0A1H7BUE0_9BACL|nr:hypothetical protein SAMN04488127_2843 [Bhargavaea ginsengi]